MKIDLILCAPRHMDYTWFRANFHWIQEHFERIYIALTQDTIKPDISNFLVNCPEYARVKWVYPQQSDGRNDWRDLAMREILLNHARSDYLCFLEQDFLMKPKFLKHAIDKLEFTPWVQFREDQRIHPAFSLMLRELAASAELDFAAGNGHDHFYEFFNSIAFKGDELTELGFIKGHDFYHMNGFTQNYHVFKEGQPFYRQEEFLTYNAESLKLPIVQESSFRKLQQDIYDKYGTTENEVIKHFFQ